MPFTFKLSKRLARIKRFVLVAAALAACEKPIPLTDPTPPSSPVVQVVIVPDSATLNPYQSQQFVAYGRTQAGDSVAVAAHWSTSGGAIGTDGMYTADTVAGTFTVTATVQPAPTAPITTASASSQLSASSQVRNRGSLAQVIETPSTASTVVGGAVQFSAYGRTKSGDSVAVSVTWSSSNTAVTTVSSGGLTTGMAAGSATITATTGNNKSGTATMTVTNVPVASVTVSPATASLAVGATTQLTATPKDASGNPLSGRVVTWATSNASVATVSATGVVTGVGAGTATITATSEGQSGTATITAIQVPVASVTVSPATVILTVGATTQLTATPKDASGNPLSGRVVTWATSNASAVTVSASGLVTGVGAGAATITATSEGKSGTAAITVTNVPVASVTVSPATASLTVGGTTQLTATPKDSSGNPLSGRVVTWATSNTSVATVSASGLVTGAAAGAATITATSEGQSGSAVMTVTNVPVASVTVSPATASLTVGGTTQLTATPKDSSGNPLTGRTVSWTTSNSTIATVSASGLVTAVAAGTATITATSEGKSGTATVTVTNAAVASVTVSPASASLTVGATTQLTATLRDALGNVLTGRAVTWTSTTPAVATVSATGLVTGVAAGPALVTATSGGQSGSAAVTVSGQTPLYTLGNGANYYVAPTGSDGNPCSAAA
ncbi:MAG TPA: Ig-like domain-containing protein, partial [Gemmatimonadales bacterium]|nr:Ig-like domain-containing protein [Gemmatimonadales bacterium]